MPAAIDMEKLREVPAPREKVPSMHRGSGAPHAGPKNPVRKNQKVSESDSNVEPGLAPDTSTRCPA